jgi:hypothetical protein
VHLEASTKPHVHQKFEIFWTNIASTMACPIFKNGPTNGLGPLGVKGIIISFDSFLEGSSSTGSKILCSLLLALPNHPVNIKIAPPLS